MKLSIVIPCYNEAGNIPALLERLDKTVRRKDVEVVLVDNGSKDDTPKLLRKLLPAYPFVRAIRVEDNQGYGYGILQGLNASKGRFIGWTHADMQADPKDMLKALKIIEKCQGRKDIFVKGRRRGRRFFDRFFTYGMGIFETAYLGERLWDINAQPNVFSREFFQLWKEPPKDYSLDLYALYLAKKRGLHVVRFPVSFQERLSGKSHWNRGLASKWKFIKRTVLFSRKLKKEGIR